MSKVLLVDTGFSAAPIYAELCRLGHEVHAVGGNPNDCLAKSAKYYWNIDYSDLEKLEKLIDQENYSFVIPGCTDRSYQSCALINKGRFPGIDKSDAESSLNNKKYFRAIAEKIDLKVPKIQNLDKDILRWPLIVKPVDAFSGKGITYLQERDQDLLVQAIEEARKISPTGEFLVEDFIVGDLHSHSAFLSDGKVIQDFIVQEHSTINQFAVDTSRLIWPPPQDLQKTMRDSVEKLAKHLNLVDGLLHTQFILSEGEAWLIEITRRCPGDLYSQLIELTTGYPYIQSYVAPFLRMPIIKKSNFHDLNLIMRHTMTVGISQNLGSICFKQPILIDRFIPLSITGDKVMESPHSRIAIIFASAKNKSEFDSLYEMALKRELYEIKP